MSEVDLGGRPTSSFTNTISSLLRLMEIDDVQFFNRSSTTMIRLRHIITRYGYVEEPNKGFTLKKVPDGYKIWRWK
jgi:hypothetical protein